MYGNCEWAFCYTNAETGKVAKGKISGGRSNIKRILFELNGKSWEPHNVVVVENELGIRAFNRLVKDWRYAGSQPEDLAKFVKENAF